MDRVIEHEGYKLATKITYDEVEKEVPKGFEGMSTDQMKKMVLMLQAQLNEREQVKEMVKNTDDGLPF